ncbi:MAG: tetratricopeptide repeat protein [Acidovorax sp.]|nr:tetratricopeptide repeat protein [Acidovorax sp.]
MLRGRTALGLCALAAVGAGVMLTAQTKQTDPAFEPRFAPLHATVFTEGGSFSGSAMSEQLQDLEPLLQQPGAAPRDVFRLYHAQASVYGRRDMPEQAAQAAATALAAMPDAASDPQLAYAQFFLRYSSIRWLADSQQFDAALQLVHGFQAEYPLPRIASLPAEMHWAPHSTPAQALDFPSQLQLLGIYEDQGYVLHEQGKYREAQQANQRLLTVARERLQALGMPERLRGVLNNLAQNCYELGELDQASHYLQERLAIALQAQDHATVYDSYFQLMVLAQEQGQSQQARQWLTAYQQHATAQQDGEQQARAQELQAELAQRQHPKQPAL